MSHTLPKGRPIGHPGRLEALEESGLLDSLEEESYDRFTRLVRSFLGAEASLVTLVANDRQFFKSQSGLGEPLRTLRQNHISYSFCRHVVEEGGPVIIEDAISDQRVSENPAVAELGVRSYLGMPISSPDGYILGSLCAVDSHPRKWTMDDLTILADLADAVTHEIELSDQTHALRQAIRLSEQGRKKMEEQVRCIIHDLRSPAAAAVSCPHLLSRSATPLSEDDKDLVSIGRESIRELIDMTNRVLETERASAIGKDRLDIEPISASLLLRRATRLVHPFIKEARLQLTTSAPDKPVFLKVDERLIHRVLINLLTNAVKYSPEGGTIFLQAERTTIDGVAMCRISVRDQGPGVREDEKKEIFQPFATGSQEGRRESASFGIGLSFCRTAVEAHGGSIGVEDAAEGGSIFFCLLPEWT